MVNNYRDYLVEKGKSRVVYIRNEWGDITTDSTDIEMNTMSNFMPIYLIPRRTWGKSLKDKNCQNLLKRKYIIEIVLCLNLVRTSFPPSMS